MTEQEVNDLLKRYKEGKCTADEQLWIHNWQNSLDRQSLDFKPEADYELLQNSLWDKITARPSQKPVRRLRYWPVAAAIAVVMGSSIAYFILQKPQPQDLYTYNKSNDIPAGSNKATLTLANGQQINLDNAKAGSLADQGGVTVTKNANGQIVYTALSGNSAPSLPSASLPQGEKAVEAYNTIRTPNGGQYQVILPDGSLVYLNAASSLKYPVKFTADERRVTLTGEGYFEIAKNPKKPFLVEAENQVVKVLGTHFNINAYESGTDPVRTTLAEGKVAIQLIDHHLPLNIQHLPSKILKPGEQAINTGSALQVNTVNVEKELAWKDGVFIFNQTSIKSVLQQICRWYDVTVDYNSLPERRFDGEISRDLPLSELLNAIEIVNHVKFKIDGRRITIQK